MRFYKIDAQGPLFLQRDATVPPADPANEGRILYTSMGEEVYYADAGGWVRMYSENNLSSLIGDVNTSGAYIRKDQDDNTSFRLTVGGGVVGGLRASNGDIIVGSGANRAASNVQLGVIKAPDGIDVLGMTGGGASADIRLQSIADGDTGGVQMAELSNVASAWIKAEVRAQDGSLILENGTNGNDARLTGDVVGDVYAENGVTLVLNNGTDGNDASFRGDVKAQDTNDIIFSGANRASSWASLASVKATNGSDVMVTNTTVANSTFAGISQRARYA